MGVITALGRSGTKQNPPNSCLKSLASSLLEVQLKTFLPSLGGGVLPPSLPSSSDCPPVFRVGVLVTANMCWDLLEDGDPRPSPGLLSPERESVREKASYFLVEYNDRGRI